MLKAEDGDYKTKAYALAQQIKLIGTLRDLPRVILKAKEDLAAFEKHSEMLKQTGLDPLNKE